MHSCSIIVGTKWPIEFSRIQHHSKENTLFKPSLLSLKNSIQELSIDLSYTPLLGNIEDLQDIQFPHLKKFKYKFSRKFEVPTEDPLQPIYLSFLGNCPELEVLNLDLNWANIESLSFLGFLQKLRDFSLKAEYFTKCSETHIPNIPALTTLEQLKIYIQFGTVDLQNISQLIQMNSKIKTIEITLSMDRILEVFAENIEFLSLENLSLGVLQIDPKNQKQLKAFQATLMKFNKIQRLDLQLDAFFVDCLHPTLKTLEQFSNLKKLRLAAFKSGQLEDQKFSKFKDLFKKILDLRSLELELASDLMNSRELSSLVDALMFLENLEKFNFKASFVKITSSSFAKFASWLESSRRIKEMKLQVKSLNEQEEKELQGILSRRDKFWEEIFE